MIHDYPTHKRGSIDYTALCFSMLAYVPNTVEQNLRNSGRWEDLRQAAYIAALDSYVKHLTVKETRALAMSEIRHELKQHGFTRMRFGEGERRIAQREFLASGFFGNGGERHQNEKMADLSMEVSTEDDRVVEIEEQFLETTALEINIPLVLLELLFDFSEALDSDIDEITSNALVNYFRKHREMLVEGD